jgi:hypothetical protein
LPIALSASACALITSFQGFSGADASASDGAGSPGDAGSDGGGGPGDSSSDGGGGPGDASSDGGGGPGDAGSDAPPHTIFITSKGYAGNLVKEADTLIEAGAFPGPDGGTFGPGDGLGAGDALCQYAATRAGLSGVFWALLNVTSGADVFARLKDTDGPWALTDGTPVANRVSELQIGQLHHDVDLDEFALGGCGNGFGPAVSPNCDNWSAASTPEGGVLWVPLAECRSISTNWLSTGTLGECANGWRLYCLQVGPGAGPNRYPAIPAGGKLAFVTSPLAANFAAFFVGDAGAGGAAHAAADAVCATQAAGAGVPGTFRAWIATSSASAIAYFAAYSMDGPWYRPDGLALAANRAALVDPSGIGVELALLANGAFAADLKEPAMTGVGDGGALGAANCQDFTSVASSVQTVNGRLSQTDNWAIDSTANCNRQMALYCFEQ